ncbi:MFS general substrate transporter [Mycena chlorophos]|uniref:MFS general substrate transporter n=1 Tax=Mycena chlorophos TaxID=658473 RepID=A0A8H6TMG6_MYCCL|nr:MFS general substrate transporter [Mycena chlorophos]
MSFSTLLTRINALLPPTLPKSASYILPASTFTALGHPNLLGPLFTEVVGGTSESNARKVSLHFRDILLKEWTLIGIPLVITGAASLGAAEKKLGLFPEHALSTFANADWTRSTPPQPDARFGSASVLSARYHGASSRLDVAPDSPTSERGATHLRRLYREHLPKIMSTWGSHEADFRWLEESVIYGLFLSDHSVLSEVETSLVTTSAILAQGLKAPSLWHLRGLRRIGVSKVDVEAIARTVGECSAWAGGRAAGPTGEQDVIEAWVQWVDEVERDLE